MELFTLGADRGAYTETDVRELARGADRLARRLRRRRRPARTSATTPRAHDTSTKTSSARRATSTGRTRASSASSTRCTRRTSWPSCGATSCPMRARRPRRRPRCRRSTSSSGYQIRAGARGDPPPPALYDGPRDGQAAGRATSRACCARIGTRHRHRRRGSGSPTSAGQRLFYPPNVSGWDDTRWLDTSTLARALGHRRRTLTKARRRPATTAPTTRPRTRRPPLAARARRRWATRR